MKVRIDKLLFDRGIAPSRQRAQALILAGRVLVDDQKVEKPGTAVADDAALRVLGDDLRYVSRGGLKLEDLFGRRRLHRRLHGLHAAARSGACDRNRYRIWPD